LELKHGCYTTANLVSHAYKGWVPRPFACPSRRLYRASRPRPALRGRGLCCSLPPEPQGVPPVARSIRRLCRPSGQTSTTSSFELARRIQGAPPHPRRSTGTTSPVRRPARTAIVVRRRFAASKDSRSSLSSPGAPRGRAEAPPPGHVSVLPLEVVAWPQSTPAAGPPPPANRAACVHFQLDEHVPKTPSTASLFFPLSIERVPVLQKFWLARSPCPFRP
jgi:hypothetical protein